jgi:hypothetical protein
MVVVSPLSSSSRRPNGALPTVVYYQVNWQISVGIQLTTESMPSTLAFERPPRTPPPLRLGLCGP